MLHILARAVDNNKLKGYIIQDDKGNTHKCSINQCIELVERGLIDNGIIISVNYSNGSTYKYVRSKPNQKFFVYDLKNKYIK